VQQLSDGLHAGRKLTLVAAPAGFGKTTLTSEWIADLLHDEPGLGVAWLSLDEIDNDPVRFLTYFLAALTQAEPRVGADGAAAERETRTEGWIAGLQLAALSRRERSDVSGFISVFAGSTRFVVDYLIEEVLERASLPVREFLRDTAILDRLSGPLCDAVTGT